MEPKTPPQADLARLREHYERDALLEDRAEDDPFSQFSAWFEEAVEAEVHEPNAMTLATATPTGRPSARIVLLKSFDSEGFVFYTNRESRKGVELAANAQAALVFWWPTLERQVRMEGHVEAVPDGIADAYYAQRPRESRLGAWASPQSRRIPDRETLAQRLAQVADRYDEEEIPRPPFWGGYRVVPERIEFWQGRPSRLHDRLEYSLQDDGSWQRHRLAP